MNEVGQFEEDLDGDRVRQTLVESVQLFTPASPLVAVRVLYYYGRTGVPEEQRFVVQRFPVIAVRQQVERRYLRHHIENVGEPCFRTHEEFVASRYTYEGQFVTLRFLFVEDEPDQSLLASPDSREWRAPVLDEQGLGVAAWRILFDVEPCVCIGRILNAAAVDTQVPRLMDEARRQQQVKEDRGRESGDANEEEDSGQPPNPGGGENGGEVVGPSDGPNE